MNEFVTRYLTLGLRFDRIEPGFVDAFTGDPQLRRAVENEPAPDPVVLAREAASLRADLVNSGLDDDRRAFLDAHLAALHCSARKFAGEDIGFVDEVAAYFDVHIGMGDHAAYEAAHHRIDAVLPGPGPLAQRLAEHRKSEEIPPDRLADCVAAFSGALRDVVRRDYALPDSEVVDYEVVTDQPWSGFNYYLGEYRSRVAINADLKQYLANLPHLIAHESYPGHHTEHCRKEAGLVKRDGQDEQTIFLVNTPQCLMAEGLADLALHAAIGPDWGLWAQEIYADLGLRFDGHRAQELAKATAGLSSVRQDAALLLHDRKKGIDDVADYLSAWLLVPGDRARKMLQFTSSPLWRAYTSTYVEGYRLLRTWLDARPAQVSMRDRFSRLLDEPLIPSTLTAL